VKTAVSIPTPLFQKAERKRRKLGISRSELYATALEHLLSEEPDAEITTALERVYAAENSALDRGLSVAQRRATSERW
jgi:metal-responsive CopG/Arc/MetJ family transcriptional regulator